LQHHDVAAHIAADHQPDLADLGVALEHAGDLPGMHEHAPHLGGLVRAAHPALDAHIRAAAACGPRPGGRLVARAAADRRVVGIERRHHAFARLAFWQGLIRAAAHDIEYDVLVHGHAFARPGFIRHHAQVGAAVGLVAVYASF